jgi:glycosyltransferase involved in cell wall biosynthesis
MRVLLLSNQGMTDGIIGNPVMLRMRDALLADKRIEEVLMLRCKHPFSVRKELREKAKKADIIHIHFGGMYALATRLLLIGIRSPKIITYHGTDIHAKTIRTTKTLNGKIRIRLNQWASFFSFYLFDRLGFVADDMFSYVPKCLNSQLKKKGFIQKLGVDYNTFKIEEKDIAKKKLNLDPNYSYALFSDISGSSIKRRDIAKGIVNALGEPYHINIMCGVNPNEVPTYINASDFVLLTSDEEGSPNIIREAHVLNKPVFSVEVGDAKTQLGGLTNSAIISRRPIEAAETIKMMLNKPYIDNTRETRRSLLDLNEITKEVINIYEQLLNH